jgi:NTE family protein
MMIREPFKCSVEKLRKLDSNVPINLVLSGGAEKGVAHIAFLEILEKRNIKINSISACSAGSLVGSMYASGLSTEEMLSFFRNTDLFQYSWITFAKAGIFNSDNYLKLLDGKIKNTFEELSLPLYISTTNLNKGVTNYFTEGDLRKPVLASCAIPGLFNPVDINGQLYSDGGVLDNFPTTPFKESEYPVIGSYVVYPSVKKNEELNSTLRVLEHSFKLLSLASEEYKFFDTFSTVCFPLEEFSGFDKKEVDAIYKKAKQYLEERL